MAPFRVAGGGKKISSGLRSRQSGIGFGPSGSGAGTGLNLYLMLNARTRYLKAETWDLRMNHARGIPSRLPLLGLNQGS